MKLKNLGTAVGVLLASFMLNALAGHCVRFGVAWFVLHKTGSSALFAAILAATSFVEAYSKPVLAPLADYFDRYKTYRNSIALTSGTSVLLWLVAFYGEFSVSLLVFLLVVQSLLAALREPAGASLLPSLVAPEHLTQAQSVRSAASSIVTIGGPVVGAALVAAIGSAGAIFTGAVVCLLSAVGLLGLGKRLLPMAPSQARWRVYFKTWHLRTLDGLRAVWLTPVERKACLATALFNAGVFPFMALVVPVWAASIPGGSASLMAVMEVGLGAGLLCGSLFFLAQANKRFGKYKTVLIGIGLSGTALFSAAWVNHVIASVALVFLLGLGVALYNVNVMTLRSLASPPLFRARLLAGAGLFSSCLHPLVIGPMGVVIERAGLPAATMICGGLILCGLVVSLANRDSQKLMATPDDELSGVYAKLYPGAFVDSSAAAKPAVADATPEVRLEGLVKPRSR